ncbi:MAG: peptide deformylase [Clostridiales bacterium]|nr:peptide deformylase [Clostridiales bacterium]
MVKEIVKDIIFLSQKSQPATIADKQIVQDLLDTLQANIEECVGLAANMIGESKRIIVVNIGVVNIPMINPIITKKSNPYQTAEGCLSLEGMRRTTRYDMIEVEYLDEKFKKKKQIFTKGTAQVIQHEIDHCDGIVI